MAEVVRDHPTTTTPLHSLLVPGEEGGRRKSRNPNVNVVNVPILNVTIVSFKVGYVSPTVHVVRVVPTQHVTRP
jgi:hypothetical protein